MNSVFNSRKAIVLPDSNMPSYERKGATKKRFIFP